MNVEVIADKLDFWMIVSLNFHGLFTNFLDCDDGEFQCNNTICINKSLVCDDKDDCGDKSDEKSCRCLPPKKFQCKNKKCLPTNFTCDGVDDCGDYSDEAVEICGTLRKVISILINFPLCIGIQRRRCRILCFY